MSINSAINAAFLECCHQVWAETIEQDVKDGLVEPCGTSRMVIRRVHRNCALDPK